MDESQELAKRLSVLIQKTKRVDELERRMKTEDQKHRDAINRLKENIKIRVNYHNMNTTILKNQIEFMGSIIKGLFATCDTCKGSCGTVINMGEEGQDFDECSSCLGTGYELAQKKEKDSK